MGDDYVPGWTSWRLLQELPELPDFVIVRWGLVLILLAIAGTLWWAAVALGASVAAFCLSGLAWAAVWGAVTVLAND